MLQKNNPTEDFRPKRAYQPIVLDLSEFELKQKLKPGQPMLKNNFKLREIRTFAMILIVIIFGFQAAKIIASGLSTKATVLGTTNEALSHLKEAQNLVQQKDFLGAEQQFIFAQQNFIEAQKNISDLGAAVSSLLKLTPQGNSASQLLKAGQQLSEAGIDLDNFYVLSSQIKVSPAGFETPDGFYETMNAAKKYLDNANTNLVAADQNLSSVSQNDLPANYKDQFSNYKEQLNFASNAATQLTELFTLFQQFVGPGQKSFLVLFENNNELRPTGGFIGTYGYFKTIDGKIVSQKISSIYDIDGQLKERIAPPGPFHDATQAWALRDSNWFVDFKQSAIKASSFYEKEAGETPDAVIAVTPDMFVDLLKITGPIDFPKYNLTLTAENFRDVIQLNTSILYDKTTNNPKQMLADFAPLLLQKLGAANDTSKTALLTTLFTNIFEKNILFYDRNPTVQAQFEKYNWAGLIAQNDADYLAIYNANIGGKKTDLDVSQSANLKSEVQPDGSIINTLTYTREHQINLNQPDKNIDYVRFLVPVGSKLISAQGFTPKPHYLANGSANPDPTNYKLDPDLMAIDDSSTVDQNSLTVTSVEAGKTSFGNWIEVDPGQKTTVTVKYLLPFNYGNMKHFSILFQKQPGNNPISLDYILSQPKKIAWYTPNNLGADNGQINFSQDLTEDTFLGIVFDDKQK
ncbi:MAG: hypothetical protein JWO40_655 [Candidatus Doudnabacteria bacterium]|nr:hypothetical protein [Candidatus Doudnabacteria bacterium]